MIWLILGVALWSGAHLWRRVAPAGRARLGEPGKGLVAVLLVVSIALMIWGYRAAAGPVLYWFGPGWTLVNNVLVLAAFYLFAASGAKTRVTRVVRHPQLTAVCVWGAAHLLVNGDARSVVLFGGLIAWALAEMILINRSEVWAPPPKPPVRKEVVAAVLALVLYVVVALIHGWVGPWPFGGVS
ncbi:MAG: NnrU family protein [Paracoccaceae bacterium]